MVRSERVYRGVAMLAAAALIAACGGHRVQVPPRLELAPYAQVGLVTFTVENAKGGLHELATERFAEYVLGAQPGIAVLELGELEEMEGTNGGSSRADDLALVREIGERYGVPAVFLGHLMVSDARPRASLVDGPRFGAEVKVELAVRLMSTRSGATLWRSSSWARQTIAQLGLVDGQPIFAAKDPNEAYGGLVNPLIYEATRDLRPTYVKR